MVWHDNVLNYKCKINHHKIFCKGFITYCDAISLTKLEQVKVILAFQWL